MQGMWAVSTERGLDLPKELGSPASQQLLRHCRRVGLVAGTDPGTGKSKGEATLVGLGPGGQTSLRPQAGFPW